MDEDESVKKQCPNGCGELVHATADNVEFYHGCDEVGCVDLVMEICPECGYTGLAWRAD